MGALGGSHGLDTCSGSAQHQPWTEGEPQSHVTLNSENPASLELYFLPCHVLIRGSLIFQNKKHSEMVKPQPSKRDGLINPPSSRLATLSKYEKIRLDASSIQVPQGQMLFWGRGE